ncbi:bcl-2/adenovirus E1B 19 kDa-interacting protein 2-like protein isoform X1 [Notechis scutatus]|uniref:Bcl-2/adenovirus E1B 19 kDa-interacting protein 2-like protein n=2 Tax=Notechis scutatus TaxID=8663 RepID=A0A6J1VP21_9SAUR|nr:bcl-2/adenovirus E1B 19 kDa-interacting protein 2-like protein isoform X1 [Notechis scutatus]
MGSFVGDGRTLPSERLKKEATEATDPAGNIQDMELREEWQDDEFPRPLPEETSEEDLEPSSSELSPIASNTLELSGRRHMRKRLQAPDLSEGSVKSGEVPESTPDDSLDINLDELETPSESEFQEGPESGHEFEWEDDLPQARRVEANLPEKFCSGRVVDTKGPDGRLWRIFLGDDHEHKVDLSTIEPYTRVISHGGYCGEGLNAVLVFASCYLPESSVPNYPYIMENLFRYIIGTLELMVAENYMLVCLNGATSRSRFPSFTWIKQCYQAIDRRLRKNLKSLVIVHPTWYIKALMTVFKPFISSKFSQKVKFVDSLDGLGQIVPLQQMHIPACVQQLHQSSSNS